MTEGLICKFYGCLPSQLDGEDVSRLLQDMQAVNLYTMIAQSVARGGPPPKAVAELIQLDFEMKKGENAKST